MGDEFKFVVRDATPEDHGFIATHFVATARMSTPRGHVTRMPNGAFGAYHYAVVSGLINSCRIRVATHPDTGINHDLYGFSITRGHHIYMVYVTKSHWRMGIGNALIDHMDLPSVIARMWPNMMHGSNMEWLWPKMEKLKYMPYWMDDKEPTGERRKAG